ncbi:MAG: branched-chain amino acid ABC transporter permease [Alphaproteobacteria bacterium]
MEQIITTILDASNYTLILLLVALGLAIIFGLMNVINMAHGELLMLGAYSLVTAMDWGAPFWLALALAPIVVGLLGVNTRRLDRYTFAFGAGLAVIAERLAVNWSYLGGLNGLLDVPPMRLGINGGGREIIEPVSVYYVALGFALIAFLALAALIRSRFGVALKAIRDNEERMRFLGYDTARYKTTAFTIGAAVSGLAGGLFVTQFGFASPSLIGFAMSAEVLIWAALGGRAVLIAAFLGAIVMRTLEGILSESLGAYWLLALGLVFILSVLAFPRGLIGEPLHWLARHRK